MTTFAINRAKLFRNSPRLIAAVADTDKNHITFITLDILKVLDEVRFAVFASKKGLGIRCLPTQQFDLDLNQVPLRHTECSNPQRQLGRTQRVIHHGPGHSLSLFFICPSAPTVIKSLGQIIKTDPLGIGVLSGGRKDDQFAVIELDVGYRNQRLMPAAIVPTQIAFLTACSLEHGQNAFNVSCCALVVIQFDFSTEEVRRWHLSSIPDHHHLLATQNRTEGIDSFHLRGFVEHHDIELQFARWQEVGNRHRTHHEDRFDLLNRASSFLDQLADGHMTTFFVQLGSKDSHLTGLIDVRHIFPNLFRQTGLCMVQRSQIQVPEAAYLVFVLDPVKLLQGGLFGVNTLHQA
ncbi:hypothetical protein D3C84_396240 [compost metagenome]